MKAAGAVAITTLAAACGSQTKTVTVTTPASTSASATTTTPVSSAASTSTQLASSTSATSTATATVHLATFRSPSGNIGCMIVSGTARCDIKQRTWSPPPRPASCPNIVDFGQGVELDGSSPGRLVCAGDTALDPAAVSLPYGTDTVVGAFRCESRTSGMTCVNPTSGHSFFISIGSYRVF
jgi:uncharacterized protein DUF6636